LRFNLSKAMFVLPNLFTISSIFCGFYAIVLASSMRGPAALYQATQAIFFAVFFDMADGRVARMTRTQSEFGVQLDSLADVISFGVAPAVIVYSWALRSLGLGGVVVAFIYIACGAIRLARFNVLAARSQNQSGNYFIGLPIPLAAGVLASLVMVHQRTAAPLGARATHILWLTLVLSYLMISNVRYRTFKNVKLGATSLTSFIAGMTAFVVMAVKVEPSFACLTFFSTYVTLGLIEEVVFFRRRRKEDAHQAHQAQLPEAKKKATR
jgi:CDP-diacylglycerol--serine O-phosphatidyltransferase